MVLRHVGWHRRGSVSRAAHHLPTDSGAAMHGVPCAPAAEWQLYVHAALARSPCWCSKGARRCGRQGAKHGTTSPASILAPQGALPGLWRQRFATPMLCHSPQCTGVLFQHRVCHFYNLILWNGTLLYITDGELGWLQGGGMAGNSSPRRSRAPLVNAVLGSHLAIAPFCWGRLSSLPPQRSGSWRNCPAGVVSTLFS